MGSGNQMYFFDIRTFINVNVLFLACAWAVVLLVCFGMGGGPPLYACRFWICRRWSVNLDLLAVGSRNCRYIVILFDYKKPWRAAISGSSHKEWELFPLYLSDGLWEKYRDTRLSSVSVLASLTQHLVVLGLRSPSENTQAIVLSFWIRTEPEEKGKKDAPCLSWLYMYIFSGGWCFYFTTACLC